MNRKLIYICEGDSFEASVEKIFEASMKRYKDEENYKLYFHPNADSLWQAIAYKADNVDGEGTVKRLDENTIECTCSSRELFEELKAGSK